MILRYLFLACIFSVLHGVQNADAENTPAKQTWDPTWADKLKKDLLLNYDKFTRPAEKDNTTLINVDVVIIHVDLEELTAIMTVNGWVKMSWNDPKLQWEPSQYGGLTTLHLADHEIWQPDILVYNSASGSNIDHYGNTLAIVSHDGSVIWVPPCTFITYCVLDLTYWPYDTQRCFVKLGSWTYDANQLNLVISKPDDTTELLSQQLVENNEWRILGATKERHQTFYPCCAEPYVDVQYNITLRRKSPAYGAIVLTPASVVVLMTLLSFWLPPTSGEKIILNGCNAIVICIFMMYFSQKLPAMANHTPLVVLFYSSSLLMVIFSMIISVIVLNLSRTKHTTPMPWAIKSFLNGAGPWLGLKHLMQQTPAAGARSEELREQPNASHFDELASSDDRQMIAPTTPSKQPAHHQDWLLLAAALDRVGFLVYCFVFAVMAAVYSV